MSILMSKDDQCSKVFLVTDRPQVYDTINIKQGVLLLLKLYFLLNLNYPKQYAQVLAIFKLTNRPGDNLLQTADLVKYHDAHSQWTTTYQLTPKRAAVVRLTRCMMTRAKRLLCSTERADLRHDWLLFVGGAC